jgi:predicted transcriptional regulator
LITPQWSARLPDDIKKMLLKIADKERRSMTEEIIYLIEKRSNELQEPEK